MHTFFKTLDSTLLMLTKRLAATAGLPEATTRTLARKVLPMMVQHLGTSAGDAQTALALCQQFARAQVHQNLSELTRPDGGWPQQRRHLAQTLLGVATYAHLVQHAGSAEEIGELLGYLALVVLSAAGQLAIDNQLDRAGFQQCRQQLAAGSAQWQPQNCAPTPVSAPVWALARRVNHTASRWPLVALAVAGILASSYCWNQQVAEAGRAALKATRVAVAAVAPGVGFASATGPVEAAATGRTHRIWVKTGAAAANKTTAHQPAPTAGAQAAYGPLSAKKTRLQLADSTSTQQPEVKPEATLNKDNRWAAAPTGSASAASRTPAPSTKFTAPHC